MTDIWPKYVAQAFLPSPLNRQLWTPLDRVKYRLFNLSNYAAERTITQHNSSLSHIFKAGRDLLDNIKERPHKKY